MCHHQGGDDLQMIKRGIMEVADVVAVNKADGDTEKAASRAASEYSGCLHLMPHR
jgi:LAO/AO transport system kinase